MTGIRAEARAEFLADDSSLGAANVDMTGLAGHKQVTDWHLLNMAARHDGLLVTFDRKIARAALPGDAARVMTLGA
jgi:predicted nucleic acid-binding protein